MAIKHSFLNDYSEGAHPRILAALTQTNLAQELGYGEDQYCQQAAALIKQAVGNPNAAVHFLSGGTQVNLTSLAAMLRPHQSVIAVQSAHINVHETGAIEATGHKINLVTGQDGKISPAEIEAVVTAHTDEHMVQPAAVFISHSTEVGSIYSAAELTAVSAACKKLGLLLYLDGARLGSALTSPFADLTLPQISQLVDIFYIGGTKNGALLGEALVINNPQLHKDFRFALKQRGALLSKGRILGIQFLEMFRDDLYFQLASHANQMAGRLAEGILAQGYTFQSAWRTNQIFPIFPNALIERLNQYYSFYTWEKVDAERSAVRLVTSWATPQSAVDEFIEDLQLLGHS